MRVFVTGASGYVGQALIPKLTAAGHKPVCLIRPGSEKKLGEISKSIEIISGEISHPDGWKDALTGIDAIVNLIGIIREFPSRGISFKKLHYQAAVDLVDLAREKGIERFIHMSALGVSPDSKAEYHRSKYQAEEYLRSSGLKFTIHRPSLILGKGNEALAMIVKLINTAPFVPVIGNGLYRMQPVDIDNVCEGFAKSLTEKKTFGKTYDIGGPDRFTYNEMLDRIASMIGKSARKVHAPVSIMKLIAGTFEYFKSFPLTTGQIEMLLEENITDSKEIFEDLNIEPITFEESLKTALA